MIAKVLSRDANPELAVVSDDDDDVSVPLTTMKAEASASMSVVQECWNFHANGLFTADYHAASYVLEFLFERRLAAQSQPSMGKSCQSPPE